MVMSLFWQLNDNVLVLKSLCVLIGLFKKNLSFFKIDFFVVSTLIIQIFFFDSIMFIGEALLNVKRLNITVVYFGFDISFLFLKRVVFWSVSNVMHLVILIMFTFILEGTKRFDFLFTNEFCLWWRCFSIGIIF